MRDYPQSGYELNLQIAVETGDRAAVRRLLARRTADDTIRLGALHPGVHADRRVTIPFRDMRHRHAHG